MVIGQLPASPGDGEIIRLTDEGISEFIEFPKDTVFMESIAQNPLYAKGVGYVPVQRSWLDGKVEVKETHIYEIRVGGEEAKHVCGPLATKDGKVDVTVFGSALSSHGILYVCSFNNNAILGYDLNNVPKPGKEAVCCIEICDVPAPNDVCIDADDDTVLYVAGGTFRRLCCGLNFSNAAFGMIYRIQLSKDQRSAAEVNIFKRGFAALAGIEAVGDQIWISELFKMYTVDKTTKETVEVWKGNDGNGLVWLADNIDVNNDFILIPAYSTASEPTVEYVLSQSHLVGVGVFFAHIFTGCVERKTLKDALEDPEVLLSFSNTYIDEGEPAKPIKLVFLKRDGSSAYHFEVDLVQARKEHQPTEIKDLSTGEVLGERPFFNDQVTHATRLQKEDGSASYIACLSFEEPRILLLQEKTFLDLMQ